ncbi:hypothetical protein ETB97_005490 [Aspergillus alliaceus]|uniref:Uncharacterized protein n=1 Tax=Petromyces alliaceus TaxID=209559 RepID=A0A8H5ZWJ8_PETAA|nr:hypothetical protein ETB97_005490 [Aspergillus burnettii]
MSTPTSPASPTNSVIRLNENNPLLASFQAYEECMDKKGLSLEEESKLLKKEVESLHYQIQNTRVALSCQAEESGGLIELNNELSYRVSELNTLLRQRHGDIEQLKAERSARDDRIECLGAWLREKEALVDRMEAQLTALQGEVDECERRLERKDRESAGLRRALLRLRKRIKELEKPSQVYSVRGGNRSDGRSHGHRKQVKARSFWHLLYLLWR